jgi:hypothetical protein
VNRLFIELYLDEDVDVLVAELLRARGFAATTTLEAGRLGSTDESQFAFAVSQENAFLTHNRTHFERIAQEYLTAGKKHFGLIVAVRRRPQDIARRLLKILNFVTSDEMENVIRYI